MSGVRLDALCSVSGVKEIVGDGSVEVSGVESDSRRVREGQLFAAIRGESFDGERFASDAVARGARAVLATRALALGVPVLVCDDVRACLGPVSHRVYGEPTRSMHSVGITGTNGKTTVTYLLEHVLSALGARPALLGTIALRGPAGAVDAALTTPEADVIARFASEQRAAGATHLVMEVSSHALAQRRVLGMTFEVCGFTNLTQDHLDFHGTMEAYGAEKARLFEEYAPRHSVIMVDTPFGAELASRAKGRVWRASMRADAAAELRVSAFSSSREGIRAVLHTPVGELSLESPLFGAHNLENLLVTLGAALALGLDARACIEALRTAQGAPGRLQRIADTRDVLVLVDYAHTPDAVARATSALRPLTSGRLFVLCGCGGDRDRKKRAPMAEAAAREGDVVVLTSDNPRTEDPLAILAEMREGAVRANAPELSVEALAAASRGYTVIADRAEAIARVIAAARAGDTVLIAGKGHEPYQIVGTEKRPFDDREQARQAIFAAGGG
jgi:UDP-N-acetylmuramoyl-L-alanyl-D-glutamate--2,6-diaminopimelate ligase